MVGQHETTTRRTQAWGMVLISQEAIQQEGQRATMQQECRRAIMQQERRRTRQTAMMAIVVMKGRGRKGRSLEVEISQGMGRQAARGLAWVARQAGKGREHLLLKLAASQRGQGHLALVVEVMGTSNHRSSRLAS